MATVVSPINKKGGVGFIGLLVISATSLSGCGVRYFSDRTTDPVIEDYIRPSMSDREEFGVLSITSTKRNAYVKLLKNGEVGVVCAEPPPDVGEAFAKTWAANLSGEANGAKGTAALNFSAATAIAPLLYRSQGLQLYRDAVSHLCFEYMNGMIDKSALLEEERTRWKDSVGVIKEELAHLPGFKPAQSVSAPILGEQGPGKQDSGKQKPGE